MAYPPSEPAIHVAWDDAVGELADRGWSLADGAVSWPQVDQLGAGDGCRWNLLEDEGVARQHGFGTYLPFERTRPAVRRIGNEVAIGLSQAARRRGLPDLPGFNEVTWTRYPPQRGRITKHRDFAEYGGVIAVFTLQGSANFRVFNSETDAVEWRASPGQVVLLRGAGWPTDSHRCPPHEVDPPTSGERIIMTLRSNSQGPGAEYHHEVG
jgi:hypothetical protein